MGRMENETREREAVVGSRMHWMLLLRKLGPGMLACAVQEPWPTWNP